MEAGLGISPFARSGDDDDLGHGMDLPAGASRPGRSSEDAILIPRPASAGFPQLFEVSEDLLGVRLRSHPLVDFCDTPFRIHEE